MENRSGNYFGTSIDTNEITNGAVTLAKLDTTGIAGKALIANGVGNPPIWSNIGLNYCKGITPTYTGSNTPTNITNITDEDLTTYASCSEAQSTGYIKIDMGSTQFHHAVYYKLDNRVGTILTTSIEYSTDNTNWTEITDTIKVDTDVNQVFTTPFVARYVRLKMIDANAGVTNFRVYEIGVW